MTITIKDREHPIYFGIRAIKNFYISIQDELKADDFIQADQLAQLIWAGIENAYYMDRKPCDVPFSDVYKEVESMLLDNEKAAKINDIYTAFSESQFVKLLKERAEPEKKKRKSTGKKLKPSPLES